MIWTKIRCFGLGLYLGQAATLGAAFPLSEGRLTFGGGPIIRLICLILVPDAGVLHLVNVT